ncbi:XTP/dITP diphosphatase [Enterococcus asini]|uniref:XTP/dITP diphosphatase n=1 Tax=Enterococcus asini TaxID=57732 RepID=UPI001E29371C|nr:XTP/dITP diphosphatase [Enterococcus asini]MCD5028575.1 XTP/dITP diphosphatase [Enterococcus asini]MDT2743056.1 XTP/dITP diphosphatase [Enterococcus asini]MDT2783222.1 XTP/dITP diphosphatase [Enterococcus asini]
MRHTGRTPRELRNIQIKTNVFKYPEGSVVISFGDTEVICNATVQPQASKQTASGQGWISVEYNQLPRATGQRQSRKSPAAAETIAETIGKALRGVCDLSRLAEREIVIDCDVVQADGGTQSASLTGAFVALRLAVNRLLAQNELANDPIRENVAGVGVALLPDGTCVLDPDEYEEEQALVGMSLVMNEGGDFLSIQAFGADTSFSGNDLNELLHYGAVGIESLIASQKEALVDKTHEVPEKTIVIATGNVGKAKEFAALFGAAGYEIKTLKDFPDLPDVAETGTTFEANARLKAETISQLIQQPVLADDSGLCVDALSGMPGVYSARFAGEQKSDAANNAKLLHELYDVPDEKRGAHFHCTLVFAAPQKDSLVVSADWYGRIGRIPRGDYGFGYDPLFIPDGMEKTSAELLPAEKNHLSHRGQAMAKLQDQWQAWLEGPVKGA